MSIGGGVSRLSTKRSAIHMIYSIVSRRSGRTEGDGRFVSGHGHTQRDESAGRSDRSDEHPSESSHRRFASRFADVHRQSRFEASGENRSDIVPVVVFV